MKKNGVEQSLNPVPSPGNRVRCQLRNERGNNIEFYYCVYEFVKAFLASY